MSYLQFDRHSFHEGAKSDMEMHARWRAFREHQIARLEQALWLAPYEASKILAARLQRIRSLQ